MADWDDVAAAVEVGALQAECALTGIDSTLGARHRQFGIKHVSGMEGSVTVSAGDGPDPCRVTVAVTIGPVGNRALESRIARLVARRLEDLRGVDAAKIRD